MLQPRGKCANVCSFSPSSRAMPTSISALRFENPMFAERQNSAQARFSCFLAALTIVASSRVLVLPSAHTLRISAARLVVEQTGWVASATGWGEAPLPVGAAGRGAVR